MDKLEELLPGIENYLTQVLAAESLSAAAEKKRQYYSERLDVLKLAFPPTLPPRNDTVDDEYIAQQRELARLRGGTLPPPQEFDDQEEYDAVEEPVTTATVTAPLSTDVDDDLYEEPVLPNTDNTSSKYDEFSDTSYESYDDEEDSGAVYINKDFHDSRDPELPRSKKKKKKDKEEKEGTPARSLPNTVFTGDLYQKVKWSWSKRYCVILEGRMMSFKSDKDTKVVNDFPLDGYDVLYLEKEAKRNHVMRVSRPGSETYWYSADNKDKADQWVEVLNTASSGGSGGSVTTSGFSSAASGSPRIDKDADPNMAVPNDGVKRCSSLTDLSMTSEGSSGDGTIGQTSSLERSDSDPKKTLKGERKGTKPLLDSLSTFFGTFGKKKGEKARKAVLAEMEEDADPDAQISGYVNVYSDLMTNKRWNRRWCVVKSGMLACYKEVGDEDAEFSFPLPGCEVASACDLKKKLAFRIIEEGKEKITLDMPGTVMQGQWLSVLIRETGCAERVGGYSYTSPDSTPGNDDDIYDEVIEDRSILAGWNLPSDFSFTSDSSTLSDLVNKQQAEKEAEETKKPPPLPTGPPPGVALSKVGADAHSSSNGIATETYYTNEDYYENTAALRDHVTVESSEQLYENTNPPSGCPLMKTTLPSTNKVNSQETIEHVDAELYDDISVDSNHEESKPKEEEFAGASSGWQSADDSQENIYQNTRSEEAGKQNESSGEESDEYLKTDKTKQQHRAQRRTSIKRPTEAPPSVPVQKKTDSAVKTSTQSATKLTEEELKEVIKCHQGPTIDEDRELLKSTQNPILSELRQRRTVPAKVTMTTTVSAVSKSSWKNTESEHLQEEISDLKKKLANIKKKRAEIRSQKLGSTDIDERIRLDDKLRDMLKEQDATETELARHTLKHAETVAKERKASLERDSLARRESLSRLERKDSFSKLEKRDSFSCKLEKKDSVSRNEVGEWDMISKKATSGEFEQVGDGKSTTSTARKYSLGSSSKSNGSGSPLSSQSRLTSTLTDRKPGLTGTRTVDTKNGHGTGRYRDHLSKYTSETSTESHTSRTGARNTLASHLAKQKSGGVRSTGPRGYEKRTDSPDSGSASPRGPRKPVKEKLKLWEDISSSTC